MLVRDFLTCHRSANVSTLFRPLLQMAIGQSLQATPTYHITGRTNGNPLGRIGVHDQCCKVAGAQVGVTGDGNDTAALTVRPVTITYYSWPGI